MIRELLRRSLAALLAALLCVPHGLVGSALAAETAGKTEKAAAVPALTPAVASSTATAAAPASAPTPVAKAKPKPKPAPKPAPAAASVLQGVELGEDTVRLKLSSPARYRSSISSNPPRLVLDLIDTDHRLGVPSVAGRGKVLLRLRSSQLSPGPKAVTRVALDLNGQANYKVSADGNDLVVALIGAEAPVAAAPVPAAEPAPVTAAPAPVAAAAPVIAAVPVVTEKTVPAPRPKVKVPPAAPAPVAAAVPEMEPGSMGVEISAELGAMAAKGEAVASSSAEPGPMLTSSGGELPPGLQSARRVVRGDMISRLPRDRVDLEFDNTDVKDIIKLLSAKAKINMIHGPDVTGTLTLHLQDVPFHEAFRTILSMMGLTTTQVGDNILRILTPSSLDKIQSASGGGASKVVLLHYGKASDIAEALQAAKTAEGRKSGMVKPNELLNALILTDTPEGMAATERLIAELDVKPQQILIETKLVEITLGRDIHYGIQWDYFEVDPGRALGKNGLTTFGSDVGAASPALPFNEGTSLAQQKPPTAGQGSRGTGVNLPANSVLGAFTLGRVTNNFYVNAAITAAASQGKAKVLSDPKIATLNNKKAEFNIITSFPYNEATVASGGGVNNNTKFLEVGIKLRVTPTLNADGRVTLDIEPEVSKPASGAVAAGAAPPVDKRYAKTWVIVKDGETIVLGGLISDNVVNTVAKIPLFGDLPLIGWLFKKKSVTRSRGELLIFVTPKLLNDA